MKDPVYVIETYTDEYKTLQQSIIYKYGNDMKRDYLRSTINPNLTELRRVHYLDENHKEMRKSMANTI